MFIGFLVGSLCTFIFFGLLTFFQKYGRFDDEKICNNLACTLRR